MRFHSFAKIGVEMKFECKLHKILALHSLQLQQRLVSTNSFIYLECKKRRYIFAIFLSAWLRTEWEWMELSASNVEHFECILFSFSICISFERRNSFGKMHHGYMQNVHRTLCCTISNDFFYSFKILYVFLFFTFSVCFTWCSASISIASIFRIVRFHFSGTLNVMATGFYVFININLSIFSHLCLSILAHWNCFGKYFLEMSFNEQMDIQQILDTQYLYLLGFFFTFPCEQSFKRKYQNSWKCVLSTSGTVMA